MFKIARRTAKIGNGINTRGELHGETTVTALDIPLKDITLSPAQLEELLPGAKVCMFDNNGNPAPWVNRIKPLVLREKIESAKVTVWLGLEEDEVVFPDANLTKVSVQLTAGGGAVLQVTVQITPDLDESITQLLEHLNRQVEVEIECEGYNAQGALPLGEAA